MDYKRFPHQDYRFWLYDPEGDGLMFFRDVIDRDTAAVNAVDRYRSFDEWDEEVENVCCGTLTHVTRMLDRQDRPGDIDEDGIDGDGVYWPDDVDFMGTYTLVSVVQKGTVTLTSCIRFAKMVADAERERCALLCERLPYGSGLAGRTYAEAIRGEGMGGKLAEGTNTEPANENQANAGSLMREAEWLFTGWADEDEFARRTATIDGADGCQDDSNQV